MARLTPEEILGGHRPMKRASKWVRWVVGILFVLLLTAAGLVFYVGSLYDQLLNTVGQGNFGTNRPVPPTERANVKPISLLILGTDFRPKTASANTDVIMVATLNPERKTATVVSLPRDVHIDPKGVQAGKANSFYAAYLYSRSFRDAPKKKADRQQYALQKTQELYANYFDIAIDYTMVIGFQTFIDLVDTFDGIVVNVDQNMCYVDKFDQTKIKLQKGEQLLDGKNALDFVRYRKSQNCRPKTRESSDFERNERQQRVMKALMEKMSSPTIVFKVDDMIEAIGKNIQTNIPTEQINLMLQTYATIKTSDVTFHPIEGKWDGHYVRVAQEDIVKSQEALKQQFTSDEPSQVESTVVPMSPLEDDGRQSTNKREP